MPAPVANFTFQVNFLGVQFYDTSENFPTGWSWNFGDGNSSTDRNPSHTYSQPGTYQIVFTATNAEGSDTYTFYLEIKDQVNFGYTLNQIISEERPSIIPEDINYEEQRKRYWMLHLQILIEPKIADGFVFDESKWPNLVKVLIAKLVVHDILRKISNEAMAQSMVSSNTANSNNITVTQGSNILSLIGESVTLTAPAGDSYQWLRDGSIISGATNQTYLVTLPGTYTVQVTTGGNTTTPDPWVVTFQATTVTTVTGSGALKSLETGPSKAEWYDSSTTVSTLFKPAAGKDGRSVFDELTSDICSIAHRLRIKLPMCKPLVHGVIVPCKVGRPDKPNIDNFLSKYGWTE